LTHRQKWEERLDDYQIDMNKLTLIHKSFINDSKTITKYLIREGQGRLPKIGCTIYFYMETRSSNGVLYNPQDGRKSQTKLILQRNEGNKAFELVLLTMRLDEEAWFRIEGELVNSLKYYNELPLNPDIDNNGIMWCKIRVIKIKHIVHPIFFDFKSFTEYLEEKNKLAKEYLELAKYNEELLDYVVEIYKSNVRELRETEKRIKITMCFPIDYDIHKKYLVNTYLNLAFVLLKQEIYGKAKEAAEEVLNIDRYNLKAKYRLFLACKHSEEDYEQAYNSLKYCLSKEPNNPSFTKYKEWLIEYEKECLAVKKEKMKVIDGVWLEDSKNAEVGPLWRECIEEERHQYISQPIC